MHVFYFYESLKTHMTITYANYGFENGFYFDASLKTHGTYANYA